MSENMKAVVVRAPMEFKVEDVPIPEVPKGGMLVKVLACGLCGSDLRTLRAGHRNVTFPWIIGHEVCGRVAETGKNYYGPWAKDDLLSVSPMAYCGRCDFCMTGEYELCEGQREIAQYWPGGFADYLPVPEACVKLGTIQKVPEDTDPAHAAIVEPISSCVNAQEKGGIGLDETVVIIGAGPVGCIHISLARARGASTIYIIDISKDRLELAAAFNPDGCINAGDTDPVEAVGRLTGGKGAHVIIVATPAPVAAVQAVEMARKGENLQFGGMPKGDSTPGVDMNIIHYNGLHVIGTTTFAPRHNRTAMNLILSGRIPADLLISHIFPLSDFENGARLALEGKVLKGVFIP